MRTLIFSTLLFLTLPACKKEEVVVAKPVEVARPVEAPKPVEAAKPADSRISMAVTDEGFVPANVKVKAGVPVTLVITRKTDETCATEILIDGTDIKTPLPLNQPVEVAWTPTKPGAVKFGCAMDKMIGGVLLVE
jgi:plastocyanin domain-containing protein